MNIRTKLSATEMAIRYKALDLERVQFLFQMIRKVTMLAEKRLVSVKVTCYSAGKFLNGLK